MDDDLASSFGVRTIVTTRSPARRAAPPRSGPRASESMSSSCRDDVAARDDRLDVLEPERGEQLAEVVHLHDVTADVDRPEERDATRHAVTLRADEIPPVAVEVDEDRDGAVSLGPRELDELHTARTICSCVASKSSVRKKNAAAAGLVSDALRLRPRRLRRSSLVSASPGRPPPALLVARPGVLVHHEAEPVDVPADRLVVVAHHERGEADRIMRPSCRAR